MRGLDGLIRIKGGRTNQANTLVNSASVTDPFTGQAALSLPAVAVQSVQVLSNPFSAEYGRFASGVVEVNTRSGTDEWKFLFEDPLPRFRWIGGNIHGVESASPHFTFAGPLKKGELYLFQSMGYGYDTVRVYSIPDPNNVRIVEKVNSYTQLDWNPSPTQRFSAALALDPQNTDYANINTFNPQPVTADYRQRGYFLSATHRWILANGGFVQSLFSAKQLDSRVYPAEAQPGQMTLDPYSNSGSYFDQTAARHEPIPVVADTALAASREGRQAPADSRVFLCVLVVQRPGFEPPGDGAAWGRHAQQHDPLRRCAGFASDEERLRAVRAGQLADPSAADAGPGPATGSRQPVGSVRQRRSAHRFCVCAHPRRTHRDSRRHRTVLRQDSVQRCRVHQVSGADHHELRQRRHRPSSTDRRPTRTWLPLPWLRVPYSLGWTLQLDRELVRGVCWYASATRAARYIASST